MAIRLHEISGLQIVKRRSAQALAVLLVFLSATPTLSAEPRMPGDALVEAVRSAYARAGRVQPFTSFPVMEDEIRRAVDELARDPEASEADLKALDRMLPPSSGNRLEADVDLAYMAYLRTSEEYIEDYPNKNGIDLYRLYLSQPVPVSWHVGWEGTDGLFLHAQQVLRREVGASDFFKPDNFWQLGQNRNPVAIENNSFMRGVLGWSRNGYVVSFGRDKAHYGPETFSSLYVSDRIPYWDSLRASVPLGSFRLDYYAATMRALKLYNTSIDPDPASEYGYYRQENQTVVVDVMHRLEWRGRKVRVAVGGDSTMVRPNNYYELSDFFPILSWHENYPKPYNLRVMADASWCFLPGWTASAQVGFDDFDASIIGVGDTGVPTIDAYILGLRWDSGTPERPVKAALEGGYTHYLWGSFDETAVRHGLSSGTLARAVYRLRLDDEAQGIPLTSPYGPGALWLRAGLNLPKLRPDLSLEAGALLLSKNTAADLLNTPYATSETVANARRMIYGELSVSARYTWKSFAFTCAPLLAVRDGTVWGELALGASYALDLRVPIGEN